jgi:methionyl-tRNA formyltransferase
LKQKVDTGNIINQEIISITPSMTAGELHDIMAIEGAELLLKTIKKIERGDVKTSKQPEFEVSKAPKIFPEDCLIDFNQPVNQVHNFVRGLSPKPGAYTFYQNKRLQLFKSQIANVDNENLKTGSLADIGKSDALYIQCRPGILIIKEIKIEGKRRMPVEDFLRGHTIDPGTIFGPSR